MTPVKSKQFIVANLNKFGSSLYYLIRSDSFAAKPQTGHTLEFIWAPFGPFGQHVRCLRFGISGSSQIFYHNMLIILLAF